MYYTVINEVTSNVTERVFSLWCKEIRKINTLDELNIFVKCDIEPTVKLWKTNNESNFLGVG